jgi:UTP-glucose-1-phosphate uridylyltransferase
MSLTLVVMAAGMGSRYGGLKQVEPVGPKGETLLDYSLFDARLAGFKRVVFVIRKDIAEAFRPVAAPYASRMSVSFAYQERDVATGSFAIPADRTRPWGTGHAVLAAESAVEGPFGVINADDFYGADAFRALAAFLPKQQPTDGLDDYAMVAYRLGATLSPNGTVARGVCRATNGLLEDVEEVTGIGNGPDGITAPGGRRFTGDEPVSLNVWGFGPTIFPRLRAQFSEFLAAHGTDLKSEFFLPSAVTSLIDHKIARVHVLPSQGEWFGVTYKEDREVVAGNIAALVESGYYPTPLWPR